MDHREKLIMTAACAIVDQASFLPVQDDHPSDDNAHGKGGYRFPTPEEQEAVKAPRSELWKWLRGIGPHLLRHGFTLTTISMPITLFEPRSWLERMCDK